MTEPTTTPVVRVTGRRIVQYIVDVILTAVVLGLAASAVNAVWPGAGFERIDTDGLTNPGRLVATATDLSWAATTLTIVVWALVFVAVPMLRDRTPAMMLLGLRITRVDGTRPSAPQHAGRAVLLVLDGAFGGLLGWIVILCSGRRQRIGDHAAGTLVVRG